MKTALLLLLASAPPASAHLAVKFDVKGPPGARYAVSASFQNDPDPTLTKTRIAFIPASGEATNTVFGYDPHPGYEVLGATFTWNSADYVCAPSRVGIYEPAWHFHQTCRPTFTMNTVFNRCDTSCVVGLADEPLDASLPPKVFPNPFRPAAGDSHTHFMNLPASARVRIYGPSGRLVRFGEATSQGLFTWNGHDDNGRDAGSGVYRVFVEGGDGRSMKLKVAIER